MKRAVAALVWKGDRILLLRRGPTAPWAPNKWCLPGGSVEGGETPAGAIVRELAEEAAIDPPYHLRFLHVTRSGLYLFAAHRSLLYPWTPWCRDGEHDAWAWVEPGEANKLPLAPGVMFALMVGVSEALAGA